MKSRDAWRRMEPHKAAVHSSNTTGAAWRLFKYSLEMHEVAWRLLKYYLELYRCMEPHEATG